MKAVARLFALYFSGTTSARVCTVVGVVLVVAGCVFGVWRTQVQSDPLSRYESALILREIPGWLLGVLSISPIAGFIVLIFASALLPSIVGHLSMSRRLRLLPNCYPKLLGSALATVGALALFMTVTVAVMVAANAMAVANADAMDVRLSAELVGVLAVWFMLAFTAYGIFHVGLWSISRFSGSMGVLTGVVLLVVVLALTMQVVARFSSSSPAGLIRALILITVAFWVIIALAIRWAPSLRAAALRGAAALRSGSASFVADPCYFRGHELDLALGTARPWFFAAGLAVPFGAALWLFEDPTVWSFYLALFAAILGGLAGFAAVRTRRLWLRTELDRAALYAQVERAYWRHSAYGLAALAACHAALGLYTGLPPVKMAWGILTLALGTFACLYLGLTMTRGIGWRTAVTTIATMALLMFTASRAAAPDANVATVAVLELALLALALVFRSVAVKRWSELDWSHCRADVEAHASA